MRPSSFALGILVALLVSVAAGLAVRGYLGTAGPGASVSASERAREMAQAASRPENEIPGGTTEHLVSPEPPPSSEPTPVRSLDESAALRAEIERLRDEKRALELELAGFESWREARDRDRELLRQALEEHEIPFADRFEALVELARNPEYCAAHPEALLAVVEGLLLDAGLPGSAMELYKWDLELERGQSWSNSYRPATLDGGGFRRVSIDVVRVRGMDNVREDGNRLVIPCDRLDGSINLDSLNSPSGWVLGQTSVSLSWGVNQMEGRPLQFNLRLEHKEGKRSCEVRIETSREKGGLYLGVFPVYGNTLNGIVSRNVEITERHTSLEPTFRRHLAWLEARFPPPE